MKQTPLKEQLRGIIQNSGLNSKTVAREAGVNDGNMSRFMRGKYGITGVVLDRLTNVLGLQLYAAVSPQAKNRQANCKSRRKKFVGETAKNN